MTQEKFLQEYDASKYKKPSVTVDMLVFSLGQEEATDIRKVDNRTLRVLLIKRGEHPFKDCWALPGGFVKMEENLDEAAYRELKEETNVEEGYLEQLYTFGDVDRDPRLRVISCAYMSLIDASRVELKASSDAKEAKWFDVTYRLIEEHKTHFEENEHRPKGYHLESVYELVLRSTDTENQEIITIQATIKEIKDVTGRLIQKDLEIVSEGATAFDHSKIIAYGIQRLRSKLEYADIAFHLMPEKFTLTDLQKVYETILDKELFKANFRRKIAPMVKETNETTQNLGHRPSQFFSFNTEWELMNK